MKVDLANYVRRRRVAEFTELSERTIFALTKAGKIPSHKVGKSVLYDLAEVRAAINAMPSAAPASA